MGRQNRGDLKVPKDPRSSKEYFVSKAKNVWGKKYDYSLVVYISAKTKVEILCPEHGSFWQTPSNHLRFECKSCGIDKNVEKFTLKTNDVIARFQQKHGNEYDYSKVNYTHWRTPVEITCKRHGQFKQRAKSHMDGAGCPTCADEMHGGPYKDVYFEKFPERHNLEALSYFVVLDVDGEQFHKIGMTRSALQGRYKDSSIAKIIYVEKTTLYEAYQIEQSVISKFEKYRFTPNVTFSGKTECFKLDHSQEQQVVAFIKELRKGTHAKSKI